MNRLTQKNDRGEWSLKGVSWKQLMTGEKITRITNSLLYGALYKLMRYEDTGLSPDQIREMDELYHKKCIEVAELQKKHRWIPVEEPLPKDVGYILISFENFSLPLVGRYEEDKTGGAFYVGDDDESCISQNLFVNAWMLLPEPYRPEVLPSGPATDPAV